MTTTMIIEHKARFNPVKQMFTSNFVNKTFSVDKSNLERMIEAINETIRIREENEINTFVQALRAGRLLSEIKPTIKHGEWTAWVQDNTRYNHIRVAQMDMKLWVTWSPYAEKLAELGIINDDDDKEQAIADKLNIEVINTSLQAMRQFTKRDTPELALQIAMDELLEGVNIIDESRAKNIIDIARAIEELPDDDKTVAMELVSKHNLQNDEIIKSIPTIRAKSPELLDEMVATGHIPVPMTDESNGRDERVVPISKASRTDVDISLGEHGIVSELERQDKFKRGFADQQIQRDNFKFLTTFTGTKEELIELLSSEMTDDEIYKVNLFERTVY